MTITLTTEYTKRMEQSIKETKSILVKLYNHSVEFQDKNMIAKYEQCLAKLNMDLSNWYVTV